MIDFVPRSRWEYYEHLLVVEALSGRRPAPVPQTQAPRFNAYLCGLWASRDCFICGCRGWCEHREPEVDMAALCGHVAQMRRAKALPGESEAA